RELRALASLGLLGINVPEELGGAQAGVVAYSVAMQEIARADASVSVAMSVTNMVAEAVTRLRSDAQKREHVRKLHSGHYVAGAVALSEPGAGSDPGAMTTTAVRTARGYRLDGTKQWITSGDRAGLIVVWARSDAAPRGTGLADARNEPQAAHSSGRPRLSA